MPNLDSPDRPIRSDDDRVRAIESDWLESCDLLSDYHDEWADNYKFHYKFDHYEDDHANTRDRRRVKPKGRQSASKHRHKLAEIMKQAFYISTRPVDMVANAEEAQAAAWWLRYEVFDPQRRFKKKFRRAGSLAMACGAGALRLACRYDLGPYPVIMPQLFDPRRIGWTPGFTDPDDIETPKVWLELDMTSDEIAAMGDYGWKNTDDLRPGSYASGDGRSFDRLTPIDGGKANAAPKKLVSSDLHKVIVQYDRFDRTKKKVSAPKNRDLSPPDWYMACPGNDCGYQQRYDPQVAPMLPKVGDQCPGCGQMPMMRVEQEVPVESTQMFPQGCRQTIILPGSEGRIFYDGPWIHSLNGTPPRNVPILFLRCYDVPLEPWGSSDTAWDWSYQVIANSVMRRGWEQMSRGGSVIVTSGDLTKYGSREPFEFTDRPITLARWRGVGDPAVRFFQPEGLPRDFVSFKQAVDSDFRSDQGTGDVSLQKEQLKGVNVGTIVEAQKSGEVPIDDQAEQWRDDLGPFLGTWYDMKRATMTVRQATRVRGQKGIPEMQMLRGEDQPNVEVLVGAQPTWGDYDGERAQQFAQLMALPPEAIELYGELNNVDPELVQKSIQVVMAIQQRQAALAQPPPAPNSPPAPAGRGGPPGAGKAPAMMGV